MGGLLIAGLALAASLIVAPLGAYAADVPTPELKDSFVVSGELFDRSLSGKYLILKQGHSGDGTQLLVVNADDGSQIQASTFIDDYACQSGNYRGAYCFSNKEDFFYSYDPGQSKIIGYPLGDKGELESTPVDPSAVENELWQLGLSDDGNTFFLTSTDGVSVRFSKIDRKTGKVLSVYSAPFFEDNRYWSAYTASSAWTSLDGKYGYVNNRTGGKLTTINLDAKTIVNEINTRALELSSSLDFPMRVMAGGTLFSGGAFASNKGEVAVTNERKEMLEHTKWYERTCNADGSLMGVLSSQLDGGGSSSSERVSECSLSVVDSVTGKTKWKSSFSTKNYSDITCISSLSSDGAFALVYAADENGSGLLYLVDTKTGSSSQISLKSDYDVSRIGAYFTQDNSKVYVAQDLGDGSASIDIYEIGASGGLLSPAAQHDDDSSSVNPIIIVVVVAILLAAGVGGFVVIRMRKHSKGYAATANGTISAAPQQTVPQNFVRQQAQAQLQQAPMPLEAPRFCGSCGGPLVPGTQFCPHCGAPVKH